MSAPRLPVPVLAVALVLALTPAVDARSDKGGKTGDWVRLAKVRLNLLEKRETLNVKTDRAVRKLRIHVENVGVVFKDVSVHFEDGEEQDVKLITGYVAAGGQTRAVELKGRTRVIDRVTVAAETRAMAMGTAEIELWGLP